MVDKVFFYFFVFAAVVFVFVFVSMECSLSEMLASIFPAIVCTTGRSKFLFRVWPTAKSNSTNPV